MNQKKYYPTAVALYITYFILGIAVTIMGQYKQSFAAMWGANQLADGSFDVSKVMAIIAAVGLGRLIAFPFAGPFSDKYGRRLSALVGVVFFAVFFIGITFTHSTVLAYILMICSGMANSFLDTSITPSCMEIFKENGAIANLFTKFAISMAQFLLPFLITFVAARDMPYSGLPDVKKAWAVVKESGCENAKLILDSWHWLRANQPVDLSVLEGIPAEKIVSVQINDVYERPYAASILRDESMHDRLAPGTGCGNTAAFCRMLKEKGIEPKAMGVEVISDAILAKGVAAAAKFNFDNTVKVLQEGWPEAMPEK